jgi:hypothetical protein
MSEFVQYVKLGQDANTIDAGDGVQKAGELIKEI